MTAIGKNRRKASGNPFELFHSQKNCAAVSTRISLQFFPVYLGPNPTFTLRIHTKTPWLNGS
jgi:hypothetical protein